MKTINSEFSITTVPGVYVLPRMFTDEQLRNLMRRGEVICHHQDGESHSIPGQPDEDDSPKGGDKKEIKDSFTFQAEKPHLLTWAAQIIYKYIPDVSLGNMCPVGVDANMQIYNLPQGAGIVPPHVDEDFNVGSFRALSSILVYLNDDYSGGETVFNRTVVIPKVEVGGGLLFRHNIIHEGLVVTAGHKFVLKTDLLFR